LNTDGEGTYGNNVLIYQDFASTAGATYNLAFKWATWNITEQTRRLGSQALWTRRTMLSCLMELSGYDHTVCRPNVNNTFTGTGDTLRLQIDENPQSGYNDNEFIVDDFSVTPVPEPATLALGGLASLFLFPANGCNVVVCAATRRCMERRVACDMLT